MIDFSHLWSHLEHYKVELAKDKDLKESVFCACTAIEKEFHTNMSKQPIHKVLKTITGWVQSECSQVNDGGASAPSVPAGPHRESKSVSSCPCVFLPSSFLYTLSVILVLLLEAREKVTLLVVHALLSRAHLMRRMMTKTR